MTSELPGLNPSRREPNSVEITRQLLDYLLSGQVEVGQRIASERKLADALGIGRSTVREALKSLHLLGLVDVRQGDGTYLVKPDSGLLPQVLEWGLLLGERRTLELVEARRVIEVDLAGLAALRREPDELDVLRERLSDMRASVDDRAAFVEADVAFHLSVAASARNRVLANMLEGIASLLHVWITRVIEAADSTDPSYQEHLPIFDAIERQDDRGARQAMADHLAKAHARLEETLSPGMTGSS